MLKQWTRDSPQKESGVTPGDVIEGLAKAGYDSKVRDDGQIEFYKEGRFIIALRLPSFFTREDLYKLGSKLQAYTRNSLN